MADGVSVAVSPYPLLPGLSVLSGLTKTTTCNSTATAAAAVGRADICVAVGYIGNTIHLGNAHPSLTHVLVLKRSTCNNGRC
jgi:hypothetical protein